MKILNLFAFAILSSILFLAPSCGNDDPAPAECILCLESAFYQVTFCQDGNNVISTVTVAGSATIFILENTTVADYEQTYLSQGYTCQPYDLPIVDNTLYDYCAECSKVDDITDQTFYESFCQDGDDLITSMGTENIQFTETLTNTNLSDYLEDLESDGYTCNVTASPPCETCTYYAFLNENCVIDVCVDGANVTTPNCNSIGGGVVNFNQNGTQSEIIAELTAAQYICGDVPSTNCSTCTTDIQGTSVSLTICDGINGLYIFTDLGDTGTQAQEVTATNTYDSVVQGYISNGYTCL
jgi:hypothetical protein